MADASRENLPAATPQSVVAALRQWMKNPDSIIPADELAQQYARLCDETNQRLARCIRLLQSGDTDRIRTLLAQDPPLLELATTLDFPERNAWLASAKKSGWTQSPALRVDFVGKLRDALGLPAVTVDALPAVAVREVKASSQKGAATSSSAAARGSRSTTKSEGSGQLAVPSLPPLTSPDLNSISIPPVRSTSQPPAPRLPVAGPARSSTQDDSWQTSPVLWASVAVATVSLLILIGLAVLWSRGEKSGDPAAELAAGQNGKMPGDPISQPDPPVIRVPPERENGAVLSIANPSTNSQGEGATGDVRRRYMGDWNVFVQNSANYHISILDNNKATKTGSGQDGTGTWEIAGEDLLIDWRDGWHDEFRYDDFGFPRTAWDGQLRRLEMLPTGEWSEQRGGFFVTFRECNRTSDYLEICDLPGSVWLRLHAGQAYLRDAKGNWQLHDTGSWRGSGAGLAGSGLPASAAVVRSQLWRKYAFAPGADRKLPPTYNQRIERVLTRIEQPYARPGIIANGTSNFPQGSTFSQSPPSQEVPPQKVPPQRVDVPPGVFGSRTFPPQSGAGNPALSMPSTKPTVAAKRELPRIAQTAIPPIWNPEGQGTNTSSTKRSSEDSIALIDVGFHAGIGDLHLVTATGSEGPAPPELERVGGNDELFWKLVSRGRQDAELASLQLVQSDSTTRLEFRWLAAAIKSPATAAGLRCSALALETTSGVHWLSLVPPVTHDAVVIGDDYLAEPTTVATPGEVHMRTEKVERFPFVFAAARFEPELNLEYPEAAKLRLGIRLTAAGLAQDACRLQASLDFCPKGIETEESQIQHGMRLKKMTLEDLDKRIGDVRKRKDALDEAQQSLEDLRTEGEKAMKKYGRVSDSLRRNFSQTELRVKDAQREYSQIKVIQPEVLRDDDVRAALTSLVATWRKSGLPRIHVVLYRRAIDRSVDPPMEIAIPCEVFGNVSAAVEVLTR